jgi:hypothetical protein
MSWVNNSVLSENQLREGNENIYNNGSFCKQDDLII